MHKFAFATMLISAMFVSAGIANANAFKVVHAFNGKDGANPLSGLTPDGNGNYLGTTSGNEDRATGKQCGNNCSYGDVYSLASTGDVSVVYAFKGGADGAVPDSPVILYNGDIYGTTLEGGGGSCINGCGTIYKITSGTGRFKVLYTFTGGLDGGVPSGVVADAQGNLYGTTVYGGVDGSGDCFDPTNGCGTVFKIAPDGSETTLYSFCSLKNCSDGATPLGGVIMDGNGNLYGTTQVGGTTCSGLCGVVFKVAPDGSESVLYNFCSVRHCTDGSEPDTGLVMDSANNLYGTTFAGGKGCGQCGTVFRLAPDGTETVLHSFKGPDGVEPEAGLVIDSDGTLYGTASHGGHMLGKQCQDAFYPGCGTVFQILPDGREKTLYVFKGHSDGSDPRASLLVAGDVLLSTSEIGGGYFGDIFQVNK